MNSGVEAAFGSQSDAIHLSDPVAVPPWTGPGVPGTYPLGSVIPSTPAQPAGGSLSPPGNAFAGGGYSSNFIDNQGTTSSLDIGDHVSSSPSVLSDVSIGGAAGSTPLLSLNQPTGATGYAYDQLTFGSNYLLGSTSLGPSTTNLPVLIGGTVQPGVGNYAQFDGVVDYYYTPGTINTGTGVFTPTGLPTYLGDVTYTFTQSGGGTFFQTLNSTTNLTLTCPPSSLLSLDGHFWVAGDPSSISVSAVPEPATLTLLGLAPLGVGLIYLRRRWCPSCRGFGDGAPSGNSPANLR